jgi:phospholipase C
MAGTRSATSTASTSTATLTAGTKPDLSEHPKQNITDGAQFTMEQIAAVVEGGLWDKVAIFITWDDWGGWYDHEDEFSEFDGDPFRYGSRVPCLVVGPFSKPGHLSHQLNSHVSLVKFCVTTYGLDPLTDRDAAANGMTDCFDFSQSPNPAPNLASGLGR